MMIMIILADDQWHAMIMMIFTNDQLHAYDQDDRHQAVPTLGKK